MSNKIITRIDLKSAQNNLNKLANSRKANSAPKAVKPANTAPVAIKPAVKEQAPIKGVEVHIGKKDYASLKASNGEMTLNGKHIVGKFVYLSFAKSKLQVSIFENKDNKVVFFKKDASTLPLLKVIRTEKDTSTFRYVR